MIVDRLMQYFDGMLEIGQTAFASVIGQQAMANILLGQESFNHWHEAALQPVLAVVIETVDQTLKSAVVP